ncbi:DNA methyltransferase [uncultured Jatrophihabitans sp.]|uniref:DNA methyltransferase n=1 Tax=uncultured Jatrophihabitans sp. TaxID=1610747 RepID=UPI0035CC7421
MRALPSNLRKQLETSVLAARRAAESASSAALASLGVFADKRPEHLDADQAVQRNGLRAKWRQLDQKRELLIAECAYEQWHRLLFARFLAENDLLLHPEYKAPVTLADCDELADELGEPDGWSVAARFAAQILPGIFRLDDPCVRLRLAPEGRHALEQILDGLPGEVFAADDALGWVYQFWQKDKKDEVNASGRKIGGADLGPVTQLFTENYMVRFLLENSLGAWWAARHPKSPLTKRFEYLRVDDDGRPAAGSFDGWPGRVAEVTVMDPCCGSGHFLVEAFSMLWQMRSEEEGLGPVAAQDAVLRDNLFGLEVDPRCVQIAMFAVALQTWKVGGGWRQLPVPNIACSGIPARAPVDEWKALADGDQRIENALVRLHILFRDADVLGSLIAPRRVTEISDPSQLQRSFEDAQWRDVSPILGEAATAEMIDPATTVLGANAAALARAADLLSRHFTLVTTNPPFLGRAQQVPTLAGFLEERFDAGKDDLASAFVLRLTELAATAGTVATVMPQYILYLSAYGNLRRTLRDRKIRVIARLGAGAFRSIGGEVVQVALLISTEERPAGDVGLAWVEAGSARTVSSKEVALRMNDVQVVPLGLPSSKGPFAPGTASRLRSLSEYARAWQGLVTGDVNRYHVKFWEISSAGDAWQRIVSPPDRTAPYRGRSTLLRWEDGQGSLVRNSSAHNFNPRDVLGSRGVLIGQVSHLAVTLYDGEPFGDTSCPLIPFSQDHLPAIWAYCSSPQYSQDVRAVNQSIVVRPGYLTQVPFDIDYWQAVADAAGPLPEPSSDDPTQWLFEGRPEVSTAPLQVAVARLVGYRWPEQAEPDDLDALSDLDGIVCLPAVAGEQPAVDRAQELLAAAFGESWSPTRVRRLLAQAGSKKTDLADWLRDEFFKHHCALFANRPFVWHIWDGQRDGFSALVNYHRLDRKTLEKLTYTYLGQDWVERQRAAVREEFPGAETRLAAALDLQRKLEAILEGEKPYDIYVRWKELYEQPIRWEPDLNDGVRLNIRPFVEADVLRAKVNVHWKKDRGTNSDASERLNDIHLSLAEKREARRRAGRT